MAHFLKQTRTVLSPEAILPFIQRALRVNTPS